jgi:hypothetical protein
MMQGQAANFYAQKGAEIDKMFELNDAIRFFGPFLV